MHTTFPRRRFLASMIAAGGFAFLPHAFALDARPREHHPVGNRFWDLRPLTHSHDYWREYVSDAAWRVLFREHTERPYSSPLNDVYDDGTYVCAACHLPLFSSDTKYDSGTGWPSFYQPFPAHVATRRDLGLWMVRTEYHCIRCGGHQGHVFDDGPEPTGERWCNNGLALRFVPADKPLPAVRG